VVELRRYALRPGARETLIALFDGELVEPQEAVGMQVLGQFRDLDDPDRFVWLRGFRDMADRERALAAFYGGPAWHEHRDAANATMLDSDDVLLLRPARPDTGLDPDRALAPGGVVAITVCWLLPEAADAFPAHFAEHLEPLLRSSGADVLAGYRTEHAPNTFPSLPVREGEEAFVWLAWFADEVAHARHLARVERTPLWRGVPERLVRPLEVARLTPTERSRLGGSRRTSPPPDPARPAPGQPARKARSPT